MTDINDINFAMRHIGERNYALLESGIKMCGSYDPNECLIGVEEQMYISELPTIWAFLEWCHADPANRAFGHGNYEQRFTEWRNTL